MAEIKPPYDELDTILNEYVDNYEFNFDEGSHTPTEFEMTLIKDAIYGLLADTDWDNAWGRHIAELAKSQPVEPVVCDNIAQCKRKGGFWKPPCKDCPAMQPVERGAPVAWVRCHPDGTLTDELMPNSIIEVVRKYSGAWVPLFARPVCPMSDEPVLGTKTWMEGGVVMTQNLTASDIYKPAPMTEDEFITAITAACASCIEDQKPAALKLKT